MKKSFYIIMISLLALTACGDDNDTPAVRPADSGVMTDADGNECGWVRIGNQEWTTQNANTGDKWFTQSYISDNGFDAEFDVSDEDAEEELCKTYGNYYTYSQAVASCPEGWRLPTDEDWKQLEVTLGMSRDDADKTGWRNGAARLMMQTAETGTGLDFKFAGQLASFITTYFEKYHFGDYGYYWSATIDTAMQNECAFIRKITPGLDEVNRVSSPTNRYMSVRYVRDAK